MSSFQEEKNYEICKEIRKHRKVKGKKNQLISGSQHIELSRQILLISYLKYVPRTRGNEEMKNCMRMMFHQLQNINNYIWKLSKKEPNRNYGPKKYNI